MSATTDSPSSNSVTKDHEARGRVFKSPFIVIIISVTELCALLIYSKCTGKSERHVVVAGRRAGANAKHKAN